MALLEFLILLSRAASIAVAPVMIFYSLAGMHSAEGRQSRSEQGSYWILLLCGVFLGISELALIYFDVSQNSIAGLAASLLRMCAFLALILHVRGRAKVSARPHLEAQMRKAYRNKGKIAGQRDS
ncbi:hypothetical protein HY995_02140 [Candidatus Micrarchaeota archaeon]|nr:hypothetical protein [Candidatus Micrarchaeota archaeon]MBI5176868.1 hypothetical protein [Candidatus Micrarchaeota archaeon]